MKNQIRNVIRYFRHHKNLKIFSRSKYVVFLYHRILPYHIEDLSNNYLHIDDFEKQINFIRNNFEICDSSNVNNLKETNHFKAIISFDDGYKDNYKYALPILDNLKVNSIFFIPTHYIDNETILWDRYLSLLVNFANRESREFCIYNKKKEIIFQKKINETISKNNFWFLINYFKFRNIEEINANLQNIKHQIKFNYSYDENDFCMSSNQIKDISQNKFFNIGSHSHYHLSFKNYDYDNIIQELSLSKRILENITLQNCCNFAFPFGSKQDFNFHQFPIIKKLGLNNIFLNINGINNIDKNNLSNKRIIMHSDKNLDNILG